MRAISLSPFEAHLRRMLQRRRCLPGRTPLVVFTLLLYLRTAISDLPVERADIIAYIPRHRNVGVLEAAPVLPFVPHLFLDIPLDIVHVILEHHLVASSLIS